MQRGITQLFHGFCNYLGQREVRRRIAIIQLSGRAEDYLVKEFVYYIAQETDGSRFCEVNSGRSNERKIDIALLKKTLRNGKECIESFVEAKFIPNRNRLNDKATGAWDNIHTILKNLKKQLDGESRRTHGWYRVCRRSKTTNIHGLVFASYAWCPDDKESDGSALHFEKVLNDGASQEFKNHDRTKPRLLTAYSGEPINVMGRRWYVSLRVGLWRTQQRL